MAIPPSNAMRLPPPAYKGGIERPRIVNKIKKRILFFPNMSIPPSNAMRLPPPAYKGGLKGIQLQKENKKRRVRDAAPYAQFEIC